MSESIGIITSESDSIEWVRQNASELGSDTVFVFDANSVDAASLCDINAHLDQVYGGPAPSMMARRNIHDQGIFANETFPAIDHEDGTDIKIHGRRFRVRDAQGQPIELGEIFSRARAVNDYNIPAESSNAVLFLNSYEDSHRAAAAFYAVCRSVNGEVLIVSPDKALSPFGKASELAGEWGAPVVNAGDSQIDREDETPSP